MATIRMNETCGALLVHADAMAAMALMADDSVDAIVTDPPYGLKFMGNRWDADIPAIELWQQCLRVLKPGGHLLAFAGTRTHHRMATRIEDAGFEIRDMIAWVYGSGFPKSLDVSKAIDKAAGAASLWAGFGTALKPALEPITVARKALVGTVAENVMAHGCGALNIDGCRIGFESDKDKNEAKPGGRATSAAGNLAGKSQGGSVRREYEHVQGNGRWPANLIHDGSDEVLACFPDTKSGALRPDMNIGESSGWADGSRPDRVKSEFHANSGSAARFFYCAKASRSERGAGNDHPTVKPLALMRYLVRLVTPPGGLVLDPFAGSGTTAIAARSEGMAVIAIERESDSFEIAVDRVYENCKPMEGEE